MPLPIYTTKGNDPHYKEANDLYDAAMEIPSSNRSAAIKKLEQARGLLETCDEKEGLRIVNQQLLDWGAK